MKRQMLTCGVMLLAAGLSFGGLYDDDAKNAKSGDLLDLDYWWAKYDAMMLEDAIKTRQPEGAIAVQLGSYRRLLDDLVKKYPNHEEIKKWKTRADEVDGKLDPNANRGATFKTGFLWTDDSYAQSWVNMRRGKMAEDQKDDETAYGCYQLAASKLDHLVDNPDMMKDYPEEARAWVKEQRPIADKKKTELGKKTHHI